LNISFFDVQSDILPLKSILKSNKTYTPDPSDQKKPPFMLAKREVVI
jgi:hypothetical protein